MYFTLILTFLAVLRGEIFGAVSAPIRIVVPGQKGINSVRVHDKNYCSEVAEKLNEMGDFDNDYYKNELATHYGYTDSNGKHVRCK